MERYDYYEAIKNDIKEYIKENNIDVTSEDFDRDDLYERLWISDSVTGNGSGSYTFSTWKAEENLCHNWDLLEEALDDFGETNVNITEKGAEWCDVTIRCYLLSRCLGDVIEELEEKEEEEEPIPWLEVNKFTPLDMYYYRCPRDKSWVVMGIDSFDNPRCLGVYKTQKEARLHFKGTGFRIHREKKYEKALEV